MNFLTEVLTPIESNLVVESAQNGKSMWINGICMQSSIKNRNGRVYPLSEITEAVRTAKARIAETNGIFGELEHPQSLMIGADRISHVITEMWMHGNDAYGKAKLLNTPMGLIAQELLKSGVKIGVSSRGAGNVNESGDVSAYSFQTYDIVIQPSAASAIPDVMYESLQTQQGHRVMTLAEQLKADPAAQKYFLREIHKFISNDLFKK